MKGTTVLIDPPGFRTFELAHRFEGGEHRFEVAYGSSFNELYYDISPAQFVTSADREELELQLRRAGARWLVPLLLGLAAGNLETSTAELRRLAEKARHGA